MSEMVERIAKALAGREKEHVTWIAMPDGYWQKQARTAIAAMREPTEGIIESLSGDIGLYDGGMNGLSVVDLARDAWREAIDRALNEH